jgi:hypothetical protein
MPEHDEQRQWLSTLRDKAGASDKNWWTAFALSLCLGFLGADRFYLEQPGWGCLKLVTGGGFLILWIADVASLLTNKMKDSHGGLVRRPF